MSGYEVRNIVLNGRSVQYRLTRKRIRNIILRIDREGHLCVSCGLYTSIRDIESFIVKNQDRLLRIMDQTVKDLEKTKIPEEFNEGDTAVVFGKRYTVHLLSDGKPHIELTDEGLNMYLRDMSDIKARVRLYDRWRKEMLRTKVLSLLDRYYEGYFANRKVSRPADIRFRSMRSRWGSCLAREGRLTFNYNLFEYPVEAVEYVVVHELSHLIEQNHSQRFYDVVSSVLPDYRERKRLLR